MTSAIKNPIILGGAVAPVYTQCTAADKFSASPGQRYRLHYKNGATPTGTIFVNANTTSVVTPPGTVPGTPAGGGRWNDVRIATSLGGSSEIVQYIPDVGPYVDGSGFVNLQHVTPTTLTLAIEGPL